MSDYPPAPPPPPGGAPPPYPNPPQYPGQAPYGGQPYPGQPYGGYGTPEGIAGLPYATFGQRLGAFLLDGLLYGLVAVPFVAAGVFMIVSQIDCPSYSDECTVDNGGMIALGILVILLGYVVLFVLYVGAMAKKGQPWGAQIVGLKVITASGEPPGWGKAIGRSLFAGFVSSNILYIGYLWMLWDDNKQTLHDKVVDTFVVRV